jgi:hypothetical protein
LEEISKGFEKLDKYLASKLFGKVPACDAGGRGSILGRAMSV